LVLNDVINCHKILLILVSEQISVNVLFEVMVLDSVFLCFEVGVFVFDFGAKGSVRLSDPLVVM
jgi:hypothetical protein